MLLLFPVAKEKANNLMEHCFTDGYRRKQDEETGNDVDEESDKTDKCEDGLSNVELNRPHPSQQLPPKVMMSTTVQPSIAIWIKSSTMSQVSLLWVMFKVRPKFCPPIFSGFQKSPLRMAGISELLLPPRSRILSLNCETDSVEPCHPSVRGTQVLWSP